MKQGQRDTVRATALRLPNKTPDQIIRYLRNLEVLPDVTDEECRAIITEARESKP